MFFVQLAMRKTAALLTKAMSAWDAMAQFHMKALMGEPTLPARDPYAYLFRAQFQETPVAQLFFSQRNIDALQTEIIGRVKAHANKAIDRQSDSELLLVMRSVYLQHGNNTDRQQDVVPEVRMLNAIVLQYCVPNIISNMSECI